MKLGTALDSQDWEAVVEIAHRQFGAQVSAVELCRACAPLLHVLRDPKAKKYYSELRDRDEDLYPWLKNRLIEIEAFPNGCRDLSGQRFTVELHISFLFLDESPEMLELLRLDPEIPEEQVARSKIFKTLLIPTPIDRVARIVSRLRGR